MMVHFILVNPARGENVGFAARALKTMGFQHLRLVESELQHSNAARKTGYASHDILDQTQTFADLAAATNDLDLIIGTTARQRIKRYDYHCPRSLAAILRTKEQSAPKIGLVFGSEENGLTTDELDHCDLLSTIPLTGNYPSLNLAQSVLIYAWELTAIPPGKDREHPDNLSLQSQLKSNAESILASLGFLKKPLVYRRMLDRLMLVSSKDMELVMSFIKKLQKRLKN